MDIVNHPTNSIAAPLKVCHFITYYLPVTQNWIYNQLIYNKECTSTVLCQRMISPEKFPFSEVYPICTSTGLRSVPARFFHKLFEQYPAKPHSTVIEQVKPNILHGHFLLESWRNYHLIKRSKIPLVTTCYGQDVTSLLRKPFWASRSRKVFDIGAAFIVEGEHMGRCLEERGCSREKINVIKLGIDISKIGINPPKPENSPVKILFTGLGREKKGAVYAVKAFIKAVNDCSVDLELHLLGDGIYRKSMENILRQAGVMEKAVFHGMKPVSQYLDLLKTIDIVLAPSIHAKDGDTEGGAPVVVIEALCAGIPVVGTLHCDIPNIVSHEHSGLLCAEKDVDALAKNLCTLAQNPTMRKEMGMHGAEYARREHDIEKQVKKITGVYKSR
ncbi:MAG: glycosyltransferase [Chitinispirillia bacterium]|nr:glycosyltransferase [Chitinispirillia bacterium]